MHTEAPIEPKLRELIAAYTSYLNKCDFCMKSHAAVAGAMYNDHDFVISSCALFNFYNRWITASGVKPLSDENHKTVGKNLAIGGYDPTNRIKTLKGTSS